jgi:hypothetical protein
MSFPILWQVLAVGHIKVAKAPSWPPCPSRPVLAQHAAHRTQMGVFCTEVAPLRSDAIMRIALVEVSAIASSRKAGVEKRPSSAVPAARMKSDPVGRAPMRKFSE